MHEPARKAAAASLLWVGGCGTTPESRIAEHPDVFARLTPDEQSLVRNGRVGIGMDAEAVKHPGPYWHRRHPYWGGYWGPGPWAFDYPAAVYDRFRIGMKDGKVTSIRQEAP